MLSSSRVCGGKVLSLPSCLPSATFKSGELFAKLVFLDFISFFAFWLSRWAFLCYLEERVFPSEFSLNTPFMVDASFCFERRKPGRFFLLDVQPQ